MWVCINVLECVCVHLYTRMHSNKPGIFLFDSFYWCYYHRQGVHNLMILLFHLSSISACTPYRAELLPQILKIAWVSRSSESTAPQSCSSGPLINFLPVLQENIKGLVFTATTASSLTYGLLCAICYVSVNVSLHVNFQDSSKCSGYVSFGNTQVIYWLRFHRALKVLFKKACRENVIEMGSHYISISREQKKEQERQWFVNGQTFTGNIF